MSYHHFEPCSSQVTRRVYESQTKFQDVDLNAVVAEAFAGTEDKFTQTYAVRPLQVYNSQDCRGYRQGCGTVVNLLVQFVNAAGVKTMGVILVDVAKGKPVPTMDGDLVYSFFEKFGTTEVTDDVTKIQYVDASVLVDQWHENGVNRFTTKDGTTVLAITARNRGECIIIKDPWTYSSKMGADVIMQRFGSPPDNDGGYYAFGLAADDPTFPWLNVHSSFYTANTKTSKLKGSETLTLFLNVVAGGELPDAEFAHVVEFELELEPHGFTKNSKQKEKKQPGYVTAVCGFATPVYGGARVIADGIYVVASGVAGSFFEILDLKGHFADYTYPTEEGKIPPSIFDPFVFKTVGKH